MILSLFFSFNFCLVFISIGIRIRMYRGRGPAAPEDPPPFCKVGRVLLLENAYWCRFEINAKLPLLFNYSIIYYTDI
jgi:hypothetical protein